MTGFRLYRLYDCLNALSRGGARRTKTAHRLICLAHVTLPYGACALTYLLRDFWRLLMTSSHCSAGTCVASAPSKCACKTRIV